jgi:serine/threonine protein phosphatase PrpC
VICAGCGETLNPSDRFCEGCGEPTELGVATLEANSRVEQDNGSAAAVSDRGRVRPHNEDAYSLVTDGGSSAVIVCDGVASTSEAGVAAGAAARAASDCLRQGLGRPDGWVELMDEAIHAAQDLLSEQSGDGRPGFEGSTTIVAALVKPGHVVVGNVGDSRAYWVGGDGSSTLLSIDDSWVREATESGLSETLARRSPRAHEITGWLGPDAATISPHVSTYHPETDGVVIVCSDGLWNYAESTESIAALVTASPQGGPAGIARHLVQFALCAGGGDNVTVGVVESSAGPRRGDTRM